MKTNYLKNIVQIHIGCMALLALAHVAIFSAATLSLRAAPGDLDSLDLGVVGYGVYAAAVQPDGKIVIAGSFSSVLGVPRGNIARLNADGTLDMGFDPSAYGEVYSVAVQADGKVLLGGQFLQLQPNGAASPTTRWRIARVNADGTLDTGFDPKANADIYSVGLQADGKVLLGGGFITLQPNGAASFTVRSRVARVNVDGTLDTGFDPRASGEVYTVALQADGKVLLGGSFSRLQPNGAASPTSRSCIARVNADGTLDLGFDPRANTSVFCVALQADGKVLLGGYFSTLQPNGATSPTTRQHFARLENDPATQALSAPSDGAALWERGGAAPELSRVTFDLSADGGATWSPLGAGTRIGATPNWQLAGLTLPATGHLRARGVTTSGEDSGSSGLIEQVAEFVFTPQISTGSTGVKPGGFGFTLTGVTNQTIVVEASTNLANWQPIWTNTLSAVSTNFVDPQWLNYPKRFYRARSN